VFANQLQLLYCTSINLTTSYATLRIVHKPQRSFHSKVHTQSMYKSAIVFAIHGTMHLVQMFLWCQVKNEYHWFNLSSLKMDTKS